MIDDPRILITNDDGVDAPGLQIMIEIAKAISKDVHVVAPSDNQSGVGHRLSFGRELEVHEHGDNVYSIDGTPGDCVVAAFTRIFADKKPDIVLSGVNQGQNLGDIIHCSGTLAGAREATMQGALGIGMSQAVDYEVGEHSVSWEAARAFGVDIVCQLMARKHSADTYFNVNFPFVQPDDVTGVRVVPHQRFAYSPFAQYQSRNEGKFFVTIPETPKPLNIGHDFHMLHNEKAITITPLTLCQTDMNALKDMHAEFLGIVPGDE